MKPQRTKKKHPECEIFRVTRLLNIFNMGKGKKNAGTSRAFKSGTCAFAKVWNSFLFCFKCMCIR